MTTNRIEPSVLHRPPQVGQAAKADEPAAPAPTPHGQAGNQMVTFAFNKDLQQLVLRVIDTETGDVVKEMPPEEQLRAAALRREAVARFIDRRL